LASVQQKQKYCSAICRKRDNKGSEPLSKMMECSECHKKFIRHHPKQKYCSKDCLMQSVLKYLAEQRKVNHVSRVFVCRECGIEFIPSFGNKHRSYCSNKCIKRRRGRVEKARRRALMRNGGNVERFDPLNVLQRDQWRCQLCGVKTPKRLRGTLGDNAPELDHIVPLAMGGDHTIANTQCLCRKCNQQKGATIAGQMRFM
jgi:5-methylcytosine-specific restriction endonuclease McrA